VILGGLDDGGGEECVSGLRRVIKHDLALAGGQWGQACCEIRLSDDLSEPAVRQILHA
jgi:hypothetical protein